MDVRADSSVVERCPDKTEVGGSIPSLPTKKRLQIGVFFLLVDNLKKR